MTVISAVCLSLSYEVMLLEQIRSGEKNLKYSPSNLARRFLAALAAWYPVMEYSGTNRFLISTECDPRGASSTENILFWYRLASATCTPLGSTMSSTFFRGVVASSFLRFFGFGDELPLPPALNIWITTQHM